MKKMGKNHEKTKINHKKIKHKIDKTKKNCEK